MTNAKGSKGKGYKKSDAPLGSKKYSPPKKIVGKCYGGREKR
jgi:hypothetical protein